MMSIPKALDLAKAAGIAVGGVTTKGTVHTRLVGRLAVQWDSTKGGAGCWHVIDPTTGEKVPGIWHAYQGQAIALAVKAQE